MGDDVVLFRVKELDKKKLIFYKDDRTNEYVFALTSRNGHENRRRSSSFSKQFDVRSTCSLDTDFPLKVKEKSKPPPRQLASTSRKGDGWESDFPLRKTNYYTKEPKKKATIFEEECECECVCCQCPCEHEDEEAPPARRPEKSSSRNNTTKKKVDRNEKTASPLAPRRRAEPQPLSNLISESPSRYSSTTQSSETSSSGSETSTSSEDTWVNEAVGSQWRDGDFEADEYAVAEETDATLTDSQFMSIPDRRSKHKKGSLMRSSGDDTRSLKSITSARSMMRKSDVDYNFLPATYVAHQISPGGANYAAPQW